ncbi:MAG: ABC transporter permease [Chlamydiota bacterium]|nr:ABC transporter permease [Chlamydiota bacterium]
MLVIEAEKKKADFWKELWAYRELIYFLSWKDLLVRYKQTVVGFVWHFLKPFLMLLTLTVVFGRLAHLGEGKSYPYVLLVISGLLPWQFFSATLSDCSESLTVNYQLITKIYFPRMILPLSTMFVSFVDFLITLSLLCCIIIYYGFVPPKQIVLLPVYIGLLVVLSFGLGIWSAAVNVRYRDCRQLVPFGIQFGLYITPVGFSSSIVPEKWRLMYHLNPMVGIIDGFRWTIIGKEEVLYLPGQCVSVGVIAVVVYLGMKYYRKVENFFADIV